MVNLRPSLCTKARDIRGRANGRGAVPENRVSFIERLPLALKNRVQNSSTRGGEKACLAEMMDVMACMGKFDQNQSMCEKEIKGFQKCFAAFKVIDKEKKELAAKGVLPSGPRAKFSGEQMNNYFKKFPSSKRTEQWFVDD